MTYKSIRQTENSITPWLTAQVPWETIKYLISLSLRPGSDPHGSMRKRVLFCPVTINITMDTDTLDAHISLVRRDLSWRRGWWFQGIINLSCASSQPPRGVRIIFLGGVRVAWHFLCAGFWHLIMRQSETDQTEIGLIVGLVFDLGNAKQRTTISIETSFPVWEVGFTCEI